MAIAKIVSAASSATYLTERNDVDSMFRLNSGPVPNNLS
jgi:hypothetical protein